jgi:polyisoprenyl-phosphate glycosyltransferase
MVQNRQNEISVVIPVYNEEQNITELYRRLTDSVRQVSDAYELLFIDDGSSDGTLPALKKFAGENSRVRFISFSRNFGHQNAIMAGIRNSCGKTVVIIDGDLQDPPELIPLLHEKLMEGYHVVYAKRSLRKGENFFKKFTAKLFYRLLKKITSIEIPLDTGDFRIISRKVAEQLAGMKEKNKFLRGQIAWLGFKQTFIEYDRQERLSGETKFTLRKMLRFALDGITSFSNFPLQIATILGFLFSFIAFIFIIYALISKFVLNQVVTGWTSLMVCTMFIGGVQLLCIGLIGEYISRISTDVKNRPSYIIGESNVDPADPEIF